LLQLFVSVICWNLAACGVLPLREFAIAVQQELVTVRNITDALQKHVDDFVVAMPLSVILALTVLQSINVLLYKMLLKKIVVLQKLLILQKQELDVFIKKTEDEILSINEQITNLDIDVNVMTEVNKLFRNNTSEEFTKIKDVVSEYLGEILY